MKPGLPQNWAVKNDGSLLFKNTVVREINKHKDMRQPFLGSKDSYYYGIWADKVYIESICPDPCVLLSITQFCKTTQCLTDIVQAVIEDISRHSPNKVFTSKDIRLYLDERFGVKMKPVDLRESIHDIRCAGRIKNLVASTKGYWVARNTVEVQKYLGDLQYRAMRIHELQAAIKTQAEETFGQQILLPLE